MNSNGLLISGSTQKLLKVDKIKKNKRENTHSSKLLLLLALVLMFIAPIFLSAHKLSDPQISLDQYDIIAMHHITSKGKAI